MKLEELLKKKKTALVNTLFDNHVREYADYKEGEEDPHGHGKRLPYVGWFWRTPDFVNKQIAIGDCGDFIGVMENNKWDYPERYMSEAECDKFVELLEHAFDSGFKGGGKKEMEEAQAEREKRFNEIWEWFQTLRIN